MADNTIVYPQSYLAQGNGDLAQVTNFRISLKNGAKVISTLRRRGNGISFGTEEATVTFDFAIDEDGMERDYVRAIQRREIKQLRGKLPGGQTLVINGAYSQVDLDGPLDDATKGSATFVGKTEDQ